MKFEPLRRIVSQPFIAATGFAALIHSTWSLGTFFSGDQPSDPVHYVLWLVPALLMAFSLDIGQLATSAEIRDGQRTKTKYLTFASFAIATYYLQFVFIASHMPTVPLSLGVRSEWIQLISLARDAAIFVFPALLPLSTTLYTFSYGKVRKAPKETLTYRAELKVERPAQSQLPIVDKPQIAGPAKTAPLNFHAYCEFCEWEGNYATQRGATNATIAHNRHAHPSNVLKH